MIVYYSRSLDGLFYYFFLLPSISETNSALISIEVGIIELTVQFQFLECYLPTNKIFKRLFYLEYLDREDKFWFHFLMGLGGKGGGGGGGGGGGSVRLLFNKNSHKQLVQLLKQ